MGVAFESLQTNEQLESYALEEDLYFLPLWKKKAKGYTTKELLARLSEGLKPEESRMSGYVGFTPFRHRLSFRIAIFLELLTRQDYVKGKLIDQELERWLK